MANVVAIVGRSNVGKSTLFNRFVEARKAIMDGSLHTTRDRQYGYAQWGSKRFTVVDTGGYIEGSSDLFAAGMREQVRLALQEANVVLFVVDCQDGVTEMDKAFAEVLRRVHKPIVLVANKAESVAASFAVPSFYLLGFGDPFPVAATNGSGTGDLLDAIVPFLHEETEEADADRLPRFAILGRPNVGKSSFLNVLVGQNRSLVSDVAGTTRDAVDTEYNLYNKRFILTDTAGIRKKAKVKDAIEFYSVLRATKAMQEADVCFVLLDAQTGVEAQDMALIALAQRYKKGIVLVANKWDLVDKAVVAADAYKKQLLRKLAPLDYVPIVLASTLKKQRVHRAIEDALVVYQNKIKKIATSELNKVMLAAVERTHPPATKGKYIKIKYCTQVSGPCPTFVFFCNHPQYVQPNYKRYLENQLRHHFDFTGVPVQVVFKKK